MKFGNTFFLVVKSAVSVRGLSTFRPTLISIEGNIGAGKSTLIESLKLQHPTWNFVDEPVGLWSSLKNDAGKLNLAFSVCTLTNRSGFRSTPLRSCFSELTLSSTSINESSYISSEDS